MAQEAAWESVESAWAVMGLLALVGFRVMSKRSRNILLLPPANINIERFLQTFALSWLAGGLAGNDKTTASTCHKLGKHERSLQ